jgi:hypothetical protein
MRMSMGSSGTPRPSTRTTIKDKFRSEEGPKANGYRPQISLYGKIF